MSYDARQIDKSAEVPPLLDTMSTVASTLERELTAALTKLAEVEKERDMLQLSWKNMDSEVARFRADNARMRDALKLWKKYYVPSHKVEITEDIRQLVKEAQEYALSNEPSMVGNVTCREARAEMKEGQ